MNNSTLLERFTKLSTPLIADACVRLNCPLRIGPPDIRPVIPGQIVAGRAVPARHYGSVDVFLEAMKEAETGDVLVIDNAGRPDEGCIGDLTALEAKVSGLAAIVVWGCHRDTAELRQIGFPVFSCGTCPAGPRRLDPREAEALLSVRFGGLTITGEDVVFGDDDGILFVTSAHVEEILSTALEIRAIERRQADSLKGGKTLREQMRFDEYLDRRSADPSYTFRKHLKERGGAIEE